MTDVFKETVNKCANWLIDAGLKFNREYTEIVDQNRIDLQCLSRIEDMPKLIANYLAVNGIEFRHLDTGHGHTWLISSKFPIGTFIVVDDILSIVQEHIHY